MALVASDLPSRPIAWRPCWRLIPSRFPPIDLFERIADPADFDALAALEGFTNDRLRDAAGEISLVPPEDRVAGPGAGYVMAAFTHVNPSGSRFTDGRYGVYYTAENLETAIAETRYHRAKFLAATNEAPIEIDMRVLAADLVGDLADISDLATERPEIRSETDYSAGQSLGREVRSLGAWGLLYESVRQPGFMCAAVFRPPVLSNCRQERHLCYVWNGVEVSEIYEKRSFERGTDILISAVSSTEVYDCGAEHGLI